MTEALKQTVGRSVTLCRSQNVLTGRCQPGGGYICMQTALGNAHMRFWASMMASIRPGEVCEMTCCCQAWQLLTSWDDHTLGPLVWMLNVYHVENILIKWLLCEQKSVGGERAELRRRKF